MASHLLPKNASMRDIFDYCEKHGLDSVAQGMIELAPPKLLREIVLKVTMQDDVHQYRPRMGSAIYREGLLHMLTHHYGMKNLTIDNILAVQGVTAGCVSTMSWLKEKGKQQIGLFTPFYTYHLRDVEAVFGNTKEAIEKHVRFIKTTQAPEFNINYEDLEENYLKLGKLDCVLLTNPGNPSTRVYTMEELERLIRLCHKYDCYVILDECYCDMVWSTKNSEEESDNGADVEIDFVKSPIGNEEILNLGNTIVCRGFSKQLGAQSWRVGYVLARNDVISELMKASDPLYICVPYLQHALGEYLLNHLEDFKRHVQETGRLMLNNLKIVKDAFEKSCNWKLVKPSGSMYALFEHKKETDVDAVADALKLGVGVCPGNIFYPPTGEYENSGLIRIHLGISKEKAERIAKQLMERSSSTN